MTEADLVFLKNLAKHNDREWFQKHRMDFDTAQKNFLELVTGLIFALSEYDESLTTIDPKSCLFRIYRDVRFSKDKSPYKNHLGAYICAGGKKSQDLPGYYVHIEPGGKSLFGSGYYMPEKIILDNLRSDIVKSVETHGSASLLVNALRDKSLRKNFPDLFEEDKAKTVPRGYDKSHPQAELLKLKHFFLHTYLTDKEVCGKQFLAKLATRGALLHSWNSTLLNVARRKL